jgi:hypothetical protein
MVSDGGSRFFNRTRSLKEKKKSFSRVKERKKETKKKQNIPWTDTVVVVDVFWDVLTDCRCGKCFCCHSVVVVGVEKKWPSSFCLGGLAYKSTSTCRG